MRRFIELLRSLVIVIVVAVFLLIVTVICVAVLVVLLTCEYSVHCRRGVTIML